MRTKRLVALIPFSFFLFVMVQFFRPKQQFIADKVVVKEDDWVESFLIKKTNEKRKINLQLLKTQLTKNLKASVTAETFPNDIINFTDINWRFGPEPVIPTPTITAATTAGYSQYWSYGNPTIVTAVVDIGRGLWDHYRRPYDMYQSFMKPLLSLDIHLYIFADQDGAAFVQKHRRQYLNKTVIHVVKLQTLPYYKYFQRIQRIIQQEQLRWNNEWEPAMKTHPESFSSEYILLMNSKAYFVREASSRNPFRSQHFYWLDAGYGHGHTNYPGSDTIWAPKNIMLPDLDSKVTFMKLRNVDLTNVDLKQLYRKDVALIVGSFFGGSSTAVQDYYEVNDRVFTSLLTNNFVDDDQTLTVLCYHSKPQLFNLVDGDWYDVFLLFN